MAENNITYREYWKEIASIQKELLRQYKEEGADTDPNEFVNDRLHETIDGHQWIIYTAYNPQVLVHSTNEDAYFDNYGNLDVSSYGEAMAKMAYAAMYQDVQDNFDMEPFEKAYAKANR